MTRPLYLDHHATTPCDADVVAEMLPYLGAEKFGNAAARANLHGRQAAAVVRRACRDIAAAIGAEEEGITLCSGATEGAQIAFSLLPDVSSARREILTGATEHPNIRAAAEGLREKGFVLRDIPVGADGVVRAETVAGMVSEKTALVAVMAANHENGAVQDVAAIAAAARAAGALYFCDATQAVGRMPVDARGCGVDMMVFSAHKIYGPQGIGALYVRTTPSLGVAPRRAGTVPLALAAGFAAACRKVAAQGAADAEAARACSDVFWRVLREKCPDVVLNGPAAGRLAGSVNFRRAGCAAEDVLRRVENDISLSSGAACLSAARKPSPVLRAMGLGDAEIAESLRLCFGRGQGEAEAVYAAGMIAAALAL